MDAYGGKTTATYFAHNYADELVSSRCVCFIPSGQTFFAGYDKFIASFDIQKPGTFKDQIGKFAQTGKIDKLILFHLKQQTSRPESCLV